MLTTVQAPRDRQRPSLPRPAASGTLALRKQRFRRSRPLRLRAYLPFVAASRHLSGHRGNCYRDFLPSETPTDETRAEAGATSWTSLLVLGLAMFGRGVCQLHQDSHKVLSEAGTGADGLEDADHY